ncbi:hypothetical protein X777_01218 [Ooceraea biroi]|uniref:Uncharacterized protein n=1 Tax=Ooceraea biroi TaxID=2015173 RepID=A0A026WRE9_OOCBI|nr:hypothetical protein X777_01218 [Ooceraea biroi]
MLVLLNYWHNEQRDRLWCLVQVACSRVCSTVLGQIQSFSRGQRKRASEA